MKNCRALLQIFNDQQQRLLLLDLRNTTIENFSLRAEATHPELEGSNCKPPAT